MELTARFRFSAAAPSGEWRYWIGKTWSDVDERRALRALSLRLSKTESVIALAIARRYEGDSLQLLDDATT